MRKAALKKDDLIPPRKPYPKSAPPPNTLGIGSEEDTMQAWKSLRPKAIKKDEARLIQYDGKILRYAAKFTKPRYEADKTRQFIISYFLSDGTVKVFEPVQPNSGIQGGKYLERRIMRNPSTGKYFQENDIEIGKTVTIASTEFNILGCDDFTTKYMSGDMQLHEMKGIDEVEHLLREKIAANAINIRKSFRRADKDFSGAITYDEFSTMLVSTKAKRENVQSRIWIVDLRIFFILSPSLSMQTLCFNCLLPRILSYSKINPKTNFNFF